MLERTGEFVRRLTDWQAASGMSQRELAALIGIHESRLSQLRSDPTERASVGLMSRAISRAPEPWKSALKQARAADLESADAALAVAS